MRLSQIVIATSIFSSALAQKVNIAAPTKGATISTGDDFTVEIDVPVIPLILWMRVRMTISSVGITILIHRRSRCHRSDTVCRFLSKSRSANGKNSLQ
jgi:hypothetical protein